MEEEADNPIDAINKFKALGIKLSGRDKMKATREELKKVVEDINRVRP